MSVVLEVTASQLETYWPEEPESCKRRWWARAVRRLPTVNRYSSCFGDVAHKVLERWLSADRLGRGPDGQPVDPFPPGWLNGYDRFGAPTGTLTPLDGEVIRKLLEAAVETGELRRDPHKSLEVPYEILVDLGDGQQARVHGYKDMEIGDDEVWDFKFLKSRHYAKSANRLRKNPQMLCYALDTYRKAKAKGKHLASVRVKHLSFIKDPKALAIIPKSAEITEAELLAFEEKLVGVCKEMLTFREVGTEGWPSKRGQELIPGVIPDPHKGQRACASFGGCHFQEICVERRTEEQYRERVRLVKDRERARQKGQKYGGNTPLTWRPQQGMFSSPQTGDDMSFAAKLAARAAVKAKAGLGEAGQEAPDWQGEGQKAPAAPQPEAPKAPPKFSPGKKASAPKTEEAKGAEIADKLRAEGGPAPFDSPTPPWAIPSCKACKGRGISSVGKVCGVCAVVSKREGLPSPEQFVIESDGQGGLVWEPLNGSGNGGQSHLPQPPADVEVEPEAEPQEQEPEEEPEPEESESAEDQEPSAEVGPEPEEPAQEEQAKPPTTKRKPGRPKGSPNKPKPTAVVVEPAEATAQRVDSSALPGFDLGAPDLPKTGIVLLVNVAAFPVSVKVQYLHTLFEAASRKLAANMNVEHYRLLNAFQRRDTLATVAGQIASLYDGQVIVGMADTPDLVDFVAALRPYCSLYCEGK